MSNEFKILQNDYIDYKNKEYHSLMLIKEYDKHSVEVISKTKSHGRMYFSSKEEAQKIYDLLFRKINRNNSFQLTNKMLDTTRSIKNLKGLVFVLTVFNRIIDQDKIGRLMKIYNIRVSSKIKKDNSMKIKVFFDTSTVCFGIFSGTFLKDDFVFEKT